MFKWEKRVWGIDSNPTWASQVALLVKNPPACAGAPGNTVQSMSQGKSLEKEIALQAVGHDLAAKKQRQ